MLIIFHNFSNLVTKKGGTDTFVSLYRPLIHAFCDFAEYCTALFDGQILILGFLKNVPPFYLQFCTALYVQFKIKKYKTSNYVPPFLEYVFIH